LLSLNGPYGRYDILLVVSSNYVSYCLYLKVKHNKGSRLFEVDNYSIALVNTLQLFASNYAKIDIVFDIVDV